MVLKVRITRLNAIHTINNYAKAKGIYVIDRRGDRKELIKSMVFNDLRFIIRIKQERLYILGNNRKKKAYDIAERFIEYNQQYKLEIDNQGFKEKSKVSRDKARVMVSSNKRIWK
ncbi:MAG TPA: hypothetical protein ENG49_02735 [Candidatus Omnitrophica bacterium]|mgnify:CR=1 FL=1|nr:hypothetical protein [Candidatus Omnitrophota bacterium]